MDGWLDGWLGFPSCSLGWMKSISWVLCWVELTVQVKVWLHSPIMDTHVDTEVVQTRKARSPITSALGTPVRVIYRAFFYQAVDLARRPLYVVDRTLAMTSSWFESGVQSVWPLGFPSWMKGWPYGPILTIRVRASNWPHYSRKYCKPP